jgi:hypothetical protein
MKKEGKGRRVAVFLDLEETIVSSWADPVFVNVEKIDSFLHNHRVREIHIFSFAIDNETDKNVFEQSGLKKAIEDKLNVTIASYPSTQEIMNACSSRTGNHFELFEFKSLWGKMRAFHDFCNAKFSGCECWLLDDVVQNTLFINHDNDTIIYTVKI